MSFLLPAQVEITWKRVWLIAVALTAVGCAIAGLTWLNRMDYLDSLKNEIASRKEASEWKVPETIKSMKAVSEKLDKQLTTMQDIESTNIKNRELEKENSKLTSAIKKLTDEKSELAEYASRLSNELNLMSLPRKEITLRGGESEELVKNRVALGVASVYPSSVTITINNDSDYLSVGNDRTIKSPTGTCKLRLIKIAPPIATFTLTCEEQSSSAGPKSDA